jgi:hypothetical protein
MGYKTDDVRVERISQSKSIHGLKYTLSWGSPIAYSEAIQYGLYRQQVQIAVIF